MKKSNLKNVFPVAGNAIEKYSREANATVFNASGSGFNGNDPNFNATGGAVSTQEPYLVNVVNASTTIAKKAVIFGAFKHLNMARFGSDEDVTVEMANPDVTYAQMLQQSGSEPFEVVLTRIECTDAVQLRRPMLLKNQIGSGDAKSRSISVGSYNSPMQYQSTMIDVQQSYRIDGSTWLEYTIKQATTVSFSFFVSAQVNIANPLNGQAPVEEFGAQRIRTFAN